MSPASPPGRSRHDGGAPERDPDPKGRVSAKCEAVFRKDHAQTRIWGAMAIPIALWRGAGFCGKIMQREKKHQTSNHRKHVRMGIGRLLRAPLMTLILLATVIGVQPALAQSNFD